MSWLIFIDTNIFLDFYRRSGPAARRQLEFIDDNRSRIITSSQVQMEFLKNRQNVLIETLSQLKGSEETIGQIPPVLIDSQASKQIRKHFDSIKEQKTRLNARMERILTNPTSHDHVYQCAQRLFRAKNEFNLSRTHKRRDDIRRLAAKRFELGYPPRKKNDTSIGDSIHWEWIIVCAMRDKSNVLIVSRDGDFGSSHGGHDHINDWLTKEFRERVGRKLRVELSKRLTDAMKRFNVEVSAEDRAEESRLIETRLLRFDPVDPHIGALNINRLLQGLDPTSLVQTPFTRIAEMARLNPLFNLPGHQPFGQADIIRRDIEEMERLRRLAENIPDGSDDEENSDDDDEEKPKKAKKKKGKRKGPKKKKDD